MRFTLGLPQLVDGIDFVPLAMGIFAIAEVIRNLESPEPRETLKTRFRDLWPTLDDFRRSWKPALRGSMLGSVLGLLPGGGAMLSSFAAYSLEKRISPHGQEFGHGAVEGVAAPEAANNAGAQTSFVPLLTLGIPGNAVIALMAGAMMIHGVQPGPQVMTSNPELFWGVIASMIIGNFMLVVINLPMLPVWVKLLSIPYRLFYPAILIFCCIGVYTLNYAVFDVLMLMVFGLMGYVLLKWRFEPAPLLLAFVLGPLMEENFRRAMMLSFGDPLIFFQRPISATLLGIAALLVAVMVLPALRRRRREAFVDAG
jgi:TctA family transporter